jgi:hypothetical protein
MGKRSERWHRNKMAFDSIIGDPYSKPDPIQGHYAMLKGRSTISIVGGEQQTSPSPVNRAKPSVIDFFVDVDAAVEDGMSTIEGGFTVFLNTYIYEDGKTFNQKERAKVEQLIGNILVERKIFPLTKYFTTIKQ